MANEVRVSEIGRNVLGAPRTYSLRPERDPGKKFSFRRYQSSAMHYLTQLVRSILVMPTGAGKTLLILADAAIRRAREMAKRRKDPTYQPKRIVILVPQRGIGTGFHRYTQKKGFRVEWKKKVYWLPRGTLVYPKSDTVESVLNALTRGSGIVVCCYHSFYRAMKDARFPGFDDLILYIDEVHHSAAEPNNANWLGSIVAAASASKSEFMMVTATFFRADGRRPLPGAGIDIPMLRRTLREHHADGCCPNLNLSFVFYDKVSPEVYEQKSRNSHERAYIHSVERLLDAYVAQYRKSPFYTLMYIPWGIKDPRCLYSSAKISKMLSDRLKAEFPGIRIMQLGSDDGRELVSKNSKLSSERTGDLQNNPYNWDVVISIKVMDEGMDWAACCQEFMPRVPSVLGIILQRIGRTLRKKTNPRREAKRAKREKREKHPSPYVSHIYFFELGIDSPTAVITAGLQALSIRMKTFVYGTEFAERICIVKRRKRKQSHGITLESLDPNFEYETMQKIHRYAEKVKAEEGAARKVIAFARQLYPSKVNTIDVIEFLLTQRVFDLDEDLIGELRILIAKRFQGRLSDGLSWNSAVFDDFLENEGRPLVDRLHVSGCVDMASILTGRNHAETLDALDRFHGRKDADEKVRAYNEYVMRVIADYRTQMGKQISTSALKESINRLRTGTAEERQLYRFMCEERRDRQCRDGFLCESIRGEVRLDA